MSEQFWTAVLNAIARVGIDAVAALLENRGDTIDDAIAALHIAKSKSLQDYVDQDALAKLKELPAPPAA
jgi:hypothetical protein